MDPKELFPALPEDLTDLEIEALALLVEEFKESARGIKNATADFTGLEPEQVVEQYRAGVVAIRAMEAEMTAREEGVANLAATLAEIDEGVDLGETETEPVVEANAELTAETEDDPAPDPEDEEVAETGTEVEETVVASATPRRLSLPAVAKQHRPLIAEASEAAASFVAAAGLPGIAGGKVLDRRGLVDAFFAAGRQRTSLPEGFRDNMVVATMDYSDLFGSDFTLDQDAQVNMGLIDRLFEQNQVASGGICAPPTNIYDVVSYGSDDRPVRDSLIPFNASRGGVNVPSGLSIADIDDGVGTVTAAQDGVGGTTGAKSCLSISCPDFDETFIQAVYACLEVGNLNGRTWPELIDRFLNELAAQHARVAETDLLDGISAASTAVTRALQYSGTSTILAGMLQAVAAYRRRVRAAASLRFQMLLPDYLVEILLNDLWNQQFDRFDITSEAQIVALFSNAGVDVTFFKDAPTGDSAGGTFGAAQAAGALHAFPDTIVGYFFPRGTFIFLDGGTLDLGIVRDSTLNASNDLQYFSETFENVAFVGVQSLKITFTITHSGELAPTGTYVA